MFFHRFALNEDHFALSGANTIQNNSITFNNCVLLKPNIKQIMLDI